MKRCFIYALLFGSGACFIMLILAACGLGVDLSRMNNSFVDAKADVDVDRNEPLRIHMQTDEDGFSATTWTGDIDLTVSDARLLASEQVVKDYSGEASYFDRHLMEGYDSSGDKWVGLLLTLKIKNVDAKPGDVSQAGEKVFRIDEFEIWPRGHVGSIIYFDGTVSNLSAKDAYCFTLKKGQTREMRVIYSIPEPLLCGQYALGIGLNDYGMPKVKMPLDVADGR